MSSFKRIPQWLGLIALVASSNYCCAIEIEGFTEPNRSVDVASPDQGIVTEVAVEVGQHVTKGEPIARLDDEVHAIMLETALQRKEARGRLESAEAEAKLRQHRLEKLRELREKGFGRKEEVERATADHEIAQAELKAAREDVLDKQWQFKKIEAEHRRRVIVSPMDGVVVARLKEPGEYVAPNEPNVVTVVELDPLLAKFSMKRSLARHIKVGDEVPVRFENTGRVVMGVVDVVSPVIDAQSGTIKVKVRLENPQGDLLSGERCSLNVTINDASETDSNGTNKVAIFP